MKPPVEFEKNVVSKTYNKRDNLVSYSLGLVLKRMQFPQLKIFWIFFLCQQSSWKHQRSKVFTKSRVSSAANKRQWIELIWTYQLIHLDSWIIIIIELICSFYVQMVSIEKMVPKLYVVLNYCTVFIWVCRMFIIFFYLYNIIL